MLGIMIFNSLNNVEENKYKVSDHGWVACYRNIEFPMVAAVYHGYDSPWNDAWQAHAKGRLYDALHDYMMNCMVCLAWAGNTLSTRLSS